MITRLLKRRKYNRRIVSFTGTSTDGREHTFYARRNSADKVAKAHGFVSHKEASEPKFRPIEEQRDMFLNRHAH